MAKKQSEGRSVKERAQDDLVMSTNSSSIVSKRSVERIYYPDEPHFFRFFVKKFQRRSPLINRGYHLRLHVIDVAVKNFLQKPSAKRKVVINLGAGYDVLPWQCLTRYSASCEGVKFIDVDFPDLMARKYKVIQETRELNSLLSNMHVPDDPLVLMESDQYIQMGCDLRDLVSIHQSLSKLIDIAKCDFLFVAEVSITYMETKAADAVIQWAGSLGQAEFCLLEQVLPDGAHHPFAKTMLSHFDKLNTSIKSVSTYPTIRAQNDRFTQLGWFDVEVETLWSAWSSEKYLSLDERQRLNGIEPFDEWEEFAIFGSHYCVVTARSMAPQAQAELPYTGNVAQQTAEMPRLETEVVFGEGTKSCQRRFAAPMKLNNQLGQEFVANVFGLGNTSRLRSLDLYGPNTADLELKPIGPSSRMCHSIVDLGEHGNILIGGRGSPSAPIKDCWIFDKSHKIWEKKEDLPTPLYRQAAVRLGQSSLALIIGGKTGPLSVSDRCLLYVPEFGWTECEVEGQRHIPVSGAIMVSTDSTPPRSSVVFEGILVGGLLEDGTIAKQTLRWQLSASDLKKPSIKFIPMVVNIKGSELRSPLLDRFGANVVMNRAGQLVVIGGIVRNNLLESQAEVLLVDVSQDNLTIISGGGLNVGSAPRPLLLGISVTRDKNDQILLTGGGATCFSMGTYWNKGHYSLRLKTPVDQGFSTTSAWSLKQTLEFTDAPVRQRNKSAGNNAEQPVVISIPRIRLDAASIFLEVLKAGKPVVIEKASLGSCVKTWSPEHLAERVGKDRKVVVHEAITAKMDFSSKNFNYVTKEFKPFLEEVQRGAKMYLRSLSEDGPADKPAMLGHDFPSLAEEFILPPELSFVTENTFSSILRITGPVNMWLHYDVMANIYCQIVGSKRLVLFPPQDVTELSFAPGSSSSSLDIFAELESTELSGTHPHEAYLNPGDILYLPPLWLHTAAPVTELGVAVNVFFRSLETGYAAGRDVYGNRDLAAYEKGRQDVTRIANAFGKVPSDMKEFYVRRLAGELLQKLHD